MTDQDQSVKIVYYIKRYIFEVLEATIALSVLFYFKNGKFQLNLKMALIIGLITLILEEYNPNFSSNVKSGIFSVSANM
jgi:hypothetical protein